LELTLYSFLPLLFQKNIISFLSVIFKYYFRI